MASCRTGRLPLPGDPINSAAQIAEFKHGALLAHIGLLAIGAMFIYKLTHPYRTFSYKGPENPHSRFIRRRFPSGGFFFGWGNNGLNRDCSLLEYACWSGYSGREYKV